MVFGAAGFVLTVVALRLSPLRTLAVDDIDSQPTDRFWTFQEIEAGIVPGLAILLIALRAWWLQQKVLEGVPKLFESPAVLSKGRSP
jgi:hypothetical protein